MKSFFGALYFLFGLALSLSLTGAEFSRPSFGTTRADPMAALREAARDAGRGQPAELLVLTQEYIQRNTLGNQAYPMSLRALALILVQRNAEAVALARQAELLAQADLGSRLNHQAQSFIYEAYLNGGAPRDALRLARLMLADFPKNTSNLNRVAWLLATGPDKALRNGAEAVRLAEQANQGSGQRDPDILDTLAAAYAEAGRFAQAAEAQAKAAEAGRRERFAAAEVGQMEARVKLYRSQKPYRDIPGRAYVLDVLKSKFS